MTDTQENFNLSPIGVIHTPYGQKFAVPRQAGLIANAVSTIEFFSPYNDPQAFEGLLGFSHLHLIFIFDKIPKESTFRAQVRPPRLGGNQKIGVFATRSPFRPTRLGLSLVKIRDLKVKNGGVLLEVLGADLVDGTPILDIKPYIPFVDSIPDARGGYASERPPEYQVEFSEKAKDNLKKLTAEQIDCVREILAQDPRPAYKDSHDSREYVARLYDYDIRFTVNEGLVQVIAASFSGERH